MPLPLETLYWLAAGGLLAASWGAVGVKTLGGFSRHQLELYCRRHLNKERFRQIIRDHDDISLGAELLQSAGTVLAVGAGGAATFAGHAATLPELLAALGLGLLILLACTIWLPAAVARVLSAPFLYRTWTFWKALRLTALPVKAGVALLSNIFARLAGQPDPDDEDHEEVFEEEIRTIVSHGIGEGLLEEDAREMIEGVMDLDETDVGDVMTPRSSVDAVEADTPWDDVVRFVSDVRRTRVPVYEKDLDNVIGVLFVKDLLAEMAKPPDQPRRPLRKLLRKPRKVVKSMPLDEMLQEFLEHRSHLAIVQDEYGGVEGVVTIEDVLEEIVGEIDDEKDYLQRDIEVVDAMTTDALGRTHVADINELLGISLPEDEDYDTIGGYLTRQLGRVPRNRDTVVADGVRITVLESTGRAVQRVRLRREENGR